MKPNKKRMLWIALGAAILILVVLLLVLVPRDHSTWQPGTEPGSNFTGPSGRGTGSDLTDPSGRGTGSDLTGPSGEETGTAAPADSEVGGTLPPEDSASGATAPVGVQYPYDLAGGRLQITSMFQYTGLNPDADFEEGENIGAIVLTNVSQDYLEDLTVTSSISDGTTLTFRVSDLPAGQTVWAFAEGNGVLDLKAVCVQIESQSSFTQDPGPLGTNVTAEVQGTEVTLTNTSDSAIPAGELRCHMVLNDIYFGGASYAYPVPELPAGGSAAVTAEDCVLGDVAPCRLK